MSFKTQSFLQQYKEVLSVKKTHKVVMFSSIVFNGNKVLNKFKNVIPQSNMEQHKIIITYSHEIV